MAFGMTISLLELNTFAHAVCVLTAYLFWWHKPLDVEELTLILGDGAHFVLAGICMQTRLGGQLPIVTNKSGRRKALLMFHGNESIATPLSTSLHSFGADTLSPGMSSRGPVLKMLEKQTVHGFQWSSGMSSSADTLLARLLHRS